MSNDTHTQSETRLSARTGALAGTTAGAAMVLATLALRPAVSASSITELAADWFTDLLPGAAIDFLLTALTFSAKPLMFVGLLLAQIIIGGALGALYLRIRRAEVLRHRSEWSRSAAFAGFLWLVGMVGLTPAFGGGLFGVDAPGSTPVFLLASAVPFLVYGLVLGGMVDNATRKMQGEVADEGRRAFLRRSGRWIILGAIAAAGLPLAAGQLFSRLSPSGAHRVPGTLSTEITPTEEFYVVSKNIIDPRVNLQDWSLRIDGMVDSPTTLDLEQLTSMPSVEQFTTLECISNKVGGELISNATWRGVPLKHILEQAGIQPGVVDIAFQAWDGYSESMPLDMAMHDEVLVAYEINGGPLPDEHGFPVRLIVPSFFGLKHVKWLTTIAPLDEDFFGYWQRREWTDVPWVKTFSRFDIPRSRFETFEDEITLGGVAFAGDRGIARVEISDDDCQTWSEVADVSRPLSPYTWVIWTARYRPPQKGSAVLRVRATDGDGVPQTAERRPTLPDGATGHHEIRVEFLRQPG